MTRIVKPLNRQAMGPHERILEKLARALSNDIKRKQRLNDEKVKETIK